MHATETRRFEVRKGRPGTGKGLFARVPIRKGEFILEYTGKKIPTKIADEMSSRYLFEIDKKWTVNGPVPKNTAGYINHACNPNVEAIIEESDDDADRIMIYAERGIAAGEELTIDYGQEYFDEFIKPVGCKCNSKKHRR
ncbi:MAG: SET domain-containing protein [Patescibacteria group bacterium]|nr:SET domain-containing protein [Patescibacteria group bacterium]